MEGLLFFIGYIWFFIWVLLRMKNTIFKFIIVIYMGILNMMVIIPPLGKIIEYLSLWTMIPGYYLIIVLAFIIPAFFFVYAITVVGEADTLKTNNEKKL